MEVHRCPALCSEKRFHSGDPFDHFVRFLLASQVERPPDALLTHCLAKRSGSDHLLLSRRCSDYLRISRQHSRRTKLTKLSVKRRHQVLPRSTWLKIPQR